MATQSDGQDGVEDRASIRIRRGIPAATSDILRDRRVQEWSKEPWTPAIRRSLFWGTDFDTLDWGRYRESVIARVLERGNDAEKAEIARFYGTTLAALETDFPKNTYRINATSQNG